MPRVGIEFNRFGEIAAAYAAEVEALVNETATAIEQDVKGRAPKAEPGGTLTGGARSAPYRTGNLRRSYHRTVANRASGTIQAEVGNDPDVAPYAIFVEYGTTRMAPRPHLRPSFEAARVPFVTRLAAILRRAGTRL